MAPARYNFLRSSSRPACERLWFPPARQNRNRVGGLKWYDADSRAECRAAEAGLLAEGAAYNY